MRLGVAGALAMVFGVIGGRLQPEVDRAPLALLQLPSASAQTYCGQVVNCGADPTVTSALDVHHRVYPGGISDDPVQLDDSERVTITAYWSLQNNISPCSCLYEISDSVTYDVTHSGTAWSGTCTGCDATNGPIYAVVTCDINADHCMSLDGDYRLNVNIKQINGIGGGDCAVYDRHLNRVEYTITNIDDGDDYDGTHCVVGSAVSPTANSFAQTDFGAFECGFSCETGPSLTVTFN